MTTPRVIDVRIDGIDVEPATRGANSPSRSPGRLCGCACSVTGGVRYPEDALRFLFLLHRIEEMDRHAPQGMAGIAQEELAVDGRVDLGESLVEFHGEDVVQ